MRALSLAEMALMARQMTDIGGQGVAFGDNTDDNVTDVEITSYFNLAVAEVWSMLLQKFPSNYGFSEYLIPVTAGVSTYPLPSDFKALLACDVGLDGTGQNYVNLSPYNIHEANIYSFMTSSTFSYVPWSNIRYQLQGNNINFIPGIGQLPGNIRLRYQPAAPILCAALPASYVSSGNYSQGALVSVTLTATNQNATAQTFVALNSGISGASPPTWQVPGLTLDNGISWAYKAPTSMFATEFDGINGWEELPIIDVAMRIADKQDKDVTALADRKAAIIARILADADDRVAGDPDTICPGWGSIESSGGFGFGWGGNGGL